MERLEEEAAREEEERRIAEEQRVAEEKRIAKEKRIAEEKRLLKEKMAEERVMEEKRVAEEKRKKLQNMAELKAREDKRVADAAEDAEEKRAQDVAYAKLVEENRIERAKAVKELEKQQKRSPAAKSQPVTVVLPPRSSGSKSKVFKSKSVISDDSDDTGVERAREADSRGKKRKRPIKMTAMGSKAPAADDDFDPEDDKDDDDNQEDPPSPITPSQPCSPCSRCTLIGKPAECRPQATRRRTQACELCHLQRQRCSWIGDHASRRSRGKRAKIEDEIYQGPAARVGERRFEGPGIAEQLAAIVGQNKEIIGIARRSLGLQEQMLHLMVRRERREEEAEKSEDEDEDGEGEEDEEEKEKSDEKRKSEICEGKKRAE
ncbi:hypothetical protein GGU11DRAFT_812665 [Lentinula aff. detonsa]|nr:hypothetical protein GGU11DRAFT_812665 [Lentinula aff. detonsa]